CVEGAGRARSRRARGLEAPGRHRAALGTAVAAAARPRRGKRAGSPRVAFPYRRRRRIVFMIPRVIAPLMVTATLRATGERRMVSSVLGAGRPPRGGGAAGVVAGPPSGVSPALTRLAASRGFRTCG